MKLAVRRVTRRLAVSPRVAAAPVLVHRLPASHTASTRAQHTRTRPFSSAAAAADTADNTTSNLYDFEEPIAPEPKRPSDQIQLVVYPYLRKSFISKTKRALVSTVLARLSSSPGSPLHSVLEKHELVGKWVDFGDFQKSTLPKVLAEFKREERNDLVKAVEIFFSPPHNGRPFFLPETPTAENITLAVERDKTRAPEELYRLDPIGSVQLEEEAARKALARAMAGQSEEEKPEFAETSAVERRLCSYFTHLDTPEMASLSSKGFSDYLFPSHQGKTDRSLLLNTTSGSVHGWRSILTQIDPCERMIAVDAKDKIYTHALYIGGRLVLHKMVSDGPVWISSLSEFLESLPSGLTLYRVDEVDTNSK